MSDADIMVNLDGEEAYIMETESGSFTVTFENGSFDSEEIGEKHFSSYEKACRFLSRIGYEF